LVLGCEIESKCALLQQQLEVVYLEEASKALLLRAVRRQLQFEIYIAVDIWLGD